MRKYWLLTLGLLLACEDEGGGNDEPVITVASVTAEAVLELVASTRLRAHPDDPVGRVGDVVRLSGGRIAVADRYAKNVKVFDEEGALQTVIGRSGRGPGEFLRLSGLLRLSADSLLVYDSGQSRMTVFDAHGEITTVVEAPLLLNFGRMRQGPGDSIIASGLYVSEEANATPLTYLHVVSRDGVVGRSWFERPEPRNSTEASAMRMDFDLDSVGQFYGVFRSRPNLYKVPNDLGRIESIPITDWGQAGELSSADFATWSGENWTAPMRLFAGSGFQMVYSKTGVAREGSDRHYITLLNESGGAVHFEVERTAVPYSVEGDQVFTLGLDPGGTPVHAVYRLRTLSDQ